MGIAVALVGLMIFDVVSVFGTVANAAADEATMSVMESVARSKLDAQASALGLWQPGLIQVTLGGNAQPTEALGLGDVVFPSLISAWAFSVDGIDSGSDNDENRKGRC